MSTLKNTLAVLGVGAAALVLYFALKAPPRAPTERTTDTSSRTIGITDTDLEDKALHACVGYDTHMTMATNYLNRAHFLSHPQSDPKHTPSRESVELATKHMGHAHSNLLSLIECAKVDSTRDISKIKDHFKRGYTDINVQRIKYDLDPIVFNVQ